MLAAGGGGGAGNVRAWVVDVGEGLCTVSALPINGGDANYMTYEPGNRNDDSAPTPLWSVQKRRGGRQDGGRNRCGVDDGKTADRRGIGRDRTLGRDGRGR